MTDTTFNPKNLPLEKVGFCQADECISKNTEQTVWLWMQYFDEHCWCCDKLESALFAPNSERYYCEECYEVMSE